MSFVQRYYAAAAAAIRAWTCPAFAREVISEAEHLEGRWSRHAARCDTRGLRVDNFTAGGVCALLCQPKRRSVRYWTDDEPRMRAWAREVMALNPQSVVDVIPWRRSYLVLVDIGSGLPLREVPR